MRDTRDTAIFERVLSPIKLKGYIRGDKRSSGTHSLNWRMAK